MQCCTCCCDKESLKSVLGGLGFSEQEITEYFSGASREQILLRKRSEFLMGLHSEQDRLSKIDYLLWLERRGEGPK